MCVCVCVLLQQSVDIELPKTKSKKENKAQEEADTKEFQEALPASKELANAAERNMLIEP